MNTINKYYKQAIMLGTYDLSFPMWPFVLSSKIFPTSIKHSLFFLVELYPFFLP